VTVPAADELFRPTVVPDQADEPAPEQPPAKGQHAKAPVRTASGRVKHDEKMTVYVTADELLDVEHARLELRRAHGLAVDRGRLVRAAVAMALADLDAHGADSALVKRLHGA
jgi:hypothetical protein